MPIKVNGKTGNSVAFGTDGDWCMVTATQCNTLSATRCVTEQ